MPSGVYTRKPGGYGPRKRKPGRTPVCAVYALLNIVSGEKYIGSSTNVVSRLDFHRRRIIRNIPINYKLAKAIEEYGAEAFAYVILEVCTPETQYQTETSWLQACQPEYNTELEAAPNGKGVGGYNLSEEHRLLISKSHETRTFYPSHTKSDDEKRRIGEKSKGNQYALGSTRSEEEKKIMAEKRTQEWAKLSPEERAARGFKSWETRRAKKLELV